MIHASFVKFHLKQTNKDFSVIYSMTIAIFKY